MFKIKKTISYITPLDNFFSKIKKLLNNTSLLKIYFTVFQYSNIHLVLFVCSWIKYFTIGSYFEYIIE